MYPRCLFIEIKPGSWYYLLEKPYAPEIADWRAEADAHGAFPSSEAAEFHLSRICPYPITRIPNLPYREGYSPDAILAERMEAGLERFRATIDQDLSLF